MSEEARGLHVVHVPPAQKRVSIQMGLAMVLFAALHFCFKSLLALPGSLPMLAAGEALILTGYLLGKNKKWTGIALGMAAGLALAIMCLLPEARDGAKRLLNQLFSLSEARNRYVYARFAVSPEIPLGATVFRTGLAVVGAMISVIIANGKSKAGALLLMLLIVGTEIYFGIIPDAAPQLFLFLCLAAILVLKGGMASAPGCYAWLLFLALAIGLLTGLLSPGIDPQLESRSEQARDWFSQTLESSAADGLHADSAFGLARREGLLAEETANGVSGEGQGARGYERSLVYRQDISSPRPVDYLRIAVILLLVVALLLVPFLPFLWLDRQKRRAAAMRAEFEAPDSAQAILAMFRHIVRCLTVFGVPGDHKGFMQLMPDDDDRISYAYKREYRCAALLWQEAAYSNHPMTAEEKETVLSLLKKTERLVYQLSGRKARFRLRYMEGLILPEDAV